MSDLDKTIAKWNQMEKERKQKEAMVFCQRLLDADDNQLKTLLLCEYIQLYDMAKAECKTAQAAKILDSIGSILREPNSTNTDDTKRIAIVKDIRDRLISNSS